MGRLTVGLSMNGNVGTDLAATSVPLGALLRVLAITVAVVMLVSSVAQAGRIKKRLDRQSDERNFVVHRTYFETSAFPPPGRLWY